MNVLMMVTWYTLFDGTNQAGIFHYEQSISLKNKGVNVALCFPFDRLMPQYRIKRTESGLLTYRFDSFISSNIFLKIYRIIKFIINFRYIVKDFKPDIIHAHVARMAGFYAIVLGKIYNIPVVVTEHAPKEQLELHKKFVRWKHDFVYKNTKANVCVSKFLYVTLKNVFPKYEFKVIYNGIIDDLSIINNSVLYKKTGYINVSIVGNFYDKYIKGYQFLFPAIKQIKDNNINILLHIIGGGKYLDFYKNMAKELSITNSCIFYGYCDRNKSYNIIKQMDFSISSSIFESAGIVCEEAMLLEKPLVVTKSGGADSLCTDKTAIIVEKNSVEALTNGIKLMIASLNKYNKNEISQYAFDNFSMTNVTKKYIELYDTIK